MGIWYAIEWLFLQRLTRGLRSQAQLIPKISISLPFSLFSSSFCLSLLQVADNQKLFQLVFIDPFIYL